MAQYPAEQQRDLAKGPVEFGIAPLARAANGRVVVGGGPWRNAALPEDILADAWSVSLEGFNALLSVPPLKLRSST